MFDFLNGLNLRNVFETGREKNKPKQVPANAIPVDQINNDLPPNQNIQMNMRGVQQAYNAQGQPVQPALGGMTPEAAALMARQDQERRLKQGITNTVEAKQQNDNAVRREVEAMPVTDKNSLQLKTNAMAVANNNIKADNQILQAVRGDSRRPDRFSTYNQPTPSNYRTGGALTRGNMIRQEGAQYREDMATDEVSSLKAQLEQAKGVDTKGNKSLANVQAERVKDLESKIAAAEKTAKSANRQTKSFELNNGALSNVMTGPEADKGLANVGLDAAGKQLFGAPALNNWLNSNKPVKADGTPDKAKQEANDKVIKAVEAAPEGEKNAATTVVTAEQNKQDWDKRIMDKPAAVRSLTEDKGFFEGIKEAVNDPSFGKNLMKFGIATMAAASVPGANTFGAIAAGLQVGLQDYIENPDKKNAVKLFDKFVETGIFTPDDYDTIMSSEDKQAAVYKKITERMQEKSASDAESANKAAELEHLRKLEEEEYKFQNDMAMEEHKKNLEAKFPKAGKKDGAGNLISPEAAELTTAQSRMDMLDNASVVINKLMDAGVEGLESRAGVVDDFLQGTLGLPLSQKGANVEQLAKDLRSKLQLIGKEMMGDGMGAMTNAEWDILEGVLSNLSFKQDPVQLMGQIQKAAAEINKAKKRGMAELESFFSNPANAQTIQRYTNAGVSFGENTPINDGMTASGYYD